MSENEQLVTEIKALREDVGRLTDIVAGPKGGRQYVSGSKAAALVGVSYPTFKAKWLDTGRLKKAHNGKIELRQVQALVNSAEVCER